MTIDRIATNAQSQIMLAQIQQDETALSQTQSQVATGLVSTTYGGIGDKTALMESARSQQTLATGYASAAQLGANQADLQDTQLNQLATLASQLQQDITTAVANHDGSTLMSQAQSIFDQAVQILNSQDANGNYIYSGGKANAPPVAVSSMAALQALPSAASAFVNGAEKASVQIGANQTVQVGVLASDVGTQLFQTLQDVANFNGGPSGNFGTTLTSAQSSFLTSEIQTARSAAQTLNDAVGNNGSVFQQLQTAVGQQQSMATMYQGFVSDVQDVDMATAASNLSQNQAALQAALEVTARLNQISLLNYLGATPASG
jgi:flagellar hook-associated protein 3 FlgL